MNIVVFDIETTGFLDEEPFHITELAWATYDTDEKRIVKCNSFIVDDYRGETHTIPKHITELTGINDNIIKNHGYTTHAVLSHFYSDVNDAHAMMARFGESFDKPAINKVAQRLSIKPLPEKPLIDDTIDIEYPAHVKGHHLGHIAADHGFLNPFPHSAMGDVLTLVYIMKTGGYDLEAAYESAKTPIVEVRALVSFQNKDLAKDAGFRWDAERGFWVKKMRRGHFEKMVGPNGEMMQDGWKFKATILK